MRTASFVLLGVLFVVPPGGLMGIADAADKSGTATIDLWLPAGATLQVNGKPVSTPPGHHKVPIADLDPNLQYEYRLKVEYAQKPESNESRRITFSVAKPGKADFRTKKPAAKATKNKSVSAGGEPAEKQAAVKSAGQEPAAGSNSEVRQASAEDPIQQPMSKAMAPKKRKAASKNSDAKPPQEPLLLQAPENARAMPAPSEAAQDSEATARPAETESSD